MRSSFRFNALLVCLFPLCATTLAAQDKFFDSKGVRLRYVDGGTGEPVVLVHGYANSIETWSDRGIIENLRRDFRVIAFDARGHGKSDKPRDPKAYGAEMGQDVVRLLDHLGIRQAHIVGFSMGSNLAVQLLTTNPDRFITATLGAGSGRRGWTDREEENTKVRIRELEGDTPFRAIVVGLWPPDQPPPSEEQIRERSLVLARKNDPLALAAFVKALRGHVVTDAAVAAVRVPTLGIVGSADAALAGLQQLKALMPSLELVVVDGATHAFERSLLGRPEFVDTIRRFIRAHSHASQ